MASDPAPASQVDPQGLPSILHVLWTGNIGGAERAVYQLVREQMRRGHEVGVAFGHAVGLYAEALQEIGCPVISFGTTSGMDVASLPRMIRGLRGYGLHHFHNVEPLSFVASGVGGPQVRVFTQRAGRQAAQPRRKQFRRVTAGLLLRKTFHAWCGNTPYAADTLTELFGIPRDTIDVVYNGFDFDLLQPEQTRDEVRRRFGIPQDSYVVGTTAFLKGWKRIDLLLQAAARLDADRLSILIVGDGPERARLERIAEELGIRGSVIFTGMRDRVAELVAAMDAFVLPSNEVETFGNSVIEAMALGIASIVFSDSPGIAAHISSGETGSVVNDLDELVQTLDRLRREPELARRLGRAGAEHVRATYAISRTAEGYEAVYRKAVARRRIGRGLGTLRDGAEPARGNPSR
ncbi:MAG: glycosyltransferase [Actinomycetota bacterium]